MKISILSMQRVINYGSFLQAYGLKKILEQKGNSVDFIDVKCKDVLDEGKTQKKFISKIKKIDKYFFKNIKFRKIEKQIKICLQKYQKDLLRLSDEYVYKTNSDLVVIGSDEVFNCDPNCAWGVSTQLFGDIEGAKCVVSYAASCGYTKIEDLKIEQKEKLKKAIGKIKKISVRDDNTFKFVNEISEVCPEINLDPVLIYDFKEEIEKAESNMNFKDKYMIVYAYRNRINNKSEIREIKKYAKKNNLKIYCVQGMLPWCDEYKNWNPFEVLAGFKNAECIVTDTFHGCVMASKFNKKFAVLIRKSNKNKISDLLNRLSLEEHQVDNINELSKTLSTEYDYKIFNDCIIYQIKNTNLYLDSCMNEVKTDKGK